MVVFVVLTTASYSPRRWSGSPSAEREETADYIAQLIILLTNKYFAEEKLEKKSLIGPRNYPTQL